MYIAIHSYIGLAYQGLEVHINVRASRWLEGGGKRKWMGEKDEKGVSHHQTAPMSLIIYSFCFFLIPALFFGVGCQISFFSSKCKAFRWQYQEPKPEA